MTIYDLKELEHAYAPPYSSAKSSINMIGFVGENILKGLIKTISWKDIQNKTSDAIILDVREIAETELGIIPGATNIPLNELRTRLKELPNNKKIFVYCAVGLRGYIATRILLQNGFTEIYNLSGGYKAWKTATEKSENSESEEIFEYSVDKKDDISQKSAASMNNESKLTLEIDVCGEQCPGPVMKLNKEILKLDDGQTLKIKATDPGFLKDIKSWCNVTGNELLSINSDKGVITALIKKGNKIICSKGDTMSSGNDKTIVVFEDNLDRALASFVIANGALAMNRKVTMFFTFWGLNVIKKQNPPKVSKDIFGKMFGMMLPKGADYLNLSKMNMGGIGSKLMKYIMKTKKIDSLTNLMEQAIESGVEIIACQMSMDVMGIKKEELIDAANIGGVAAYLEAAEQSDVNLFI